MGTVPDTPVDRTPYHLLSRNSRYRWWRPLLELLLFVVLAVVFAGTFEAATGRVTDPVWRIAFAFGGVAVLLPAVLLTVRWAGRRKPGTVSGVDGRVRWPWLLRCTRWALVAVGLAALVGLARGGWEAASWPGWGTWAKLAAIALLVVPVQAAAEEYLCRGWLLQAVSSWTRSPWPAAVLTSALFVVLHEYGDPLVIADLVVFALALCLLTVRTGGLEAATALHAVGNAVGLLVAATQGVPDLAQDGDYALADVLPGTAATLAYTWWVLRTTRHGRLVPRRAEHGSSRRPQAERPSRMAETRKNTPPTTA